MFYNVENLFDPIDDPSTQDNDFTPAGKNKWNWKRLEKKRNAIAKTIIAAGEGKAPALVGLCEVENYLVLKQLVEQTPLARVGYGIVHHDSPDPRGIEVALLYRSDCFQLLQRQFYPLTYASGSSQTREILYVKGVFNRQDTLHLLVNHWPSKLGGEKKSRPKRMTAARKVKQLCDSIFTRSPGAKIIIMGDFNDSPGSIPLREGLASLRPDSAAGNARLYNLMLPLQQEGTGSYKYKGEWETIDQFIVSGRLLHRTKASVFAPEVLLTEDKKYRRKKPLRTYEGPRYLGGVSDHLPILLRLNLNQ